MIKETNTILLATESEENKEIKELETWARQWRRYCISNDIVHESRIDANDKKILIWNGEYEVRYLDWLCFVIRKEGHKEMRISNHRGAEEYIEKTK